MTTRNKKAKARTNASDRLVRSAMAAVLGKSHGGARDLYAAFGYDRTVQADELVAMYYRNDIANRVVRAFPQATWRDTPIVRDEKGNGLEKGKPEFSPFALAVDEFFDKHKVMRYLERVDRTASLGKFGLLVMGFDDGEDLHMPLPSGQHKLLYLSPYGETSITISTWDTNVKSARYGKPVIYNVQNREPNLTSTTGTDTGPTHSFRVHYTRVIHVSEFLEQDDVFGTPRLLPIYNRLKDLEKVVGGSAETFWVTANRGLALWVDKEAQVDDAAIADMKDQAEEFQHQLRRYLVGQGMTAQVLGADDPDPKPNFDALMQLIAGASGIPMRILLGSERGELSSAQDENNWNERIDERRRNFATPSILQPFIARMIATGNVPAPEGKWWVEWPEKTAPLLDQATVANTKAQALATYSNSPIASMVVPVAEFRKEILGLPPTSEYQEELLEEVDEEEQAGMPEDEPPEGEETPVEDDEGEDGDEIEEPPKMASRNAASLYAYRDVTNKKAILRWAKDQGIANAARDLHVTVMYSEKAGEWTKARHSSIIPPDQSVVLPPDQTRWMEKLGDGSALALCFKSPEMTARHHEMRSAGFSHSYASFRPHITITVKNADKVDLSRIQPYTGAIALGPEKFAEVK